MMTTIVKWGNSQGIRLPKILLENINLAENDTVDVFIENNAIMIKKPKPNKEHKSIEKLFEGYDGTYYPVNIDWGKTVGKEIW